jgi:hypothetical protein
VKIKNPWWLTPRQRVALATLLLIVALSLNTREDRWAQPHLHTEGPSTLTFTVASAAASGSNTNVSAQSVSFTNYGLS